MPPNPGEQATRRRSALPQSCSPAVVLSPAAVRLSTSHFVGRELLLHPADEPPSVVGIQPQCHDRFLGLVYRHEELTTQRNVHIGPAGNDHVQDPALVLVPIHLEGP
jgi:hypothetical protein